MEGSKDSLSNPGSSSSEDTVVEVLNTEEAVGLPCEQPHSNIWGEGAVVFGYQDCETDGDQDSVTDKQRTSSTSVNRIELHRPDLSSTLSILPAVENSDAAMAWEEGAYTGYKLNCHKKKRKVDNLIHLYDKDAVNSLQDKEIYKQKLDEISSTAIEAAEYIDDLVDQLDVNNEERRIQELTAIKKTMLDAVKKNELEVKAEMQRIVEQAATSATPPTQTSSGGITAADLQEAIAGLAVNGSSSGDSSRENLSLRNQNKISKITLVQEHLKEDAADFLSTLTSLKSPGDMSDSEVIYHMKLIKTWEKKSEDLVTELRKLQVEAIGVMEVTDMVAVVEQSVKSLKTVLKGKIISISDEDKKRGLNSLCENRNRDTVVFPEAFKGNFGDNVFKFRDDIKAAIRDSQVKKADQVKTLLKYLRGDARLRVGDHQPDLDTALETLVGFYGNSNLIWLKCKQDFEQAFRGDPTKNWGDLGSTKRVDVIAKVMEFIRQSKQYAKEYPELKEEIVSSNTVSLLTKIMPIDYIERIYLAMDTVTATPTSKIDKIEEILTKLKTCAILAVNQLGTVKPDRTKQIAETGRNPLGLNMISGHLCTVDSKHECHKSSKCQPNWGLLVRDQRDSR